MEESIHAMKRGTGGVEGRGEGEEKATGESAKEEERKRRRRRMYQCLRAAGGLLGAL